ncbi:hypothetical protein GCM10010307_11240 [Streptomyces vastus]|uniref:Uncharacterized protein n=1 Tax=Streptomyces vastus TaxID=285451 RepID=A0ABN3QF01_9ACTN
MYGGMGARRDEGARGREAPRGMRGGGVRVARRLPFTDGRDRQRALGGGVLCGGFRAGMPGWGQQVAVGLVATRRITS